MNIFYSITERLKKSPLVLLLWYLRGKYIPPPHIYKQKIVSEYGKKFGVNILIESGTYKGDMVYGMRNIFKRIITIELSNYFFEKANERLKNYKNINIILGNSGKEIKKILKSIQEPCVFWLDGHYSEGNTAKGKLNTPIIEELKSILNHKNKSHVILIDDARHFNGKGDYPKISDLKKLLKGYNYILELENDIIKIIPQA